MDEKESSKKPIDSLSRWWWPGQWLRIVWAVWTDQLWYWQNVLPQLQGKRAASFFFQALFGSGLLAIGPALAAGVIVDTIAIRVDWELWALGFLVGVFITAMAGVLTTLFNGANWGISACAILGIKYPFNVSILFGTSIYYPFPFTIFLLYGTVGGLLAGISENLFKVAKQGKTLSASMIIEHMALFALATGLIAESVMVGVMTGLTYLFGTQLGRIWATRQVPDVETRIKLVNLTNTENLF